MWSEQQCMRCCHEMNAPRNSFQEGSSFVSGNHAAEILTLSSAMVLTSAEEPLTNVSQRLQTSQSVGVRCRDNWVHLVI